MDASDLNQQDEDTACAFIEDVIAYLKEHESYATQSISTLDDALMTISGFCENSKEMEDA